MALKDKDSPSKSSSSGAHDKKESKGASGEHSSSGGGDHKDKASGDKKADSSSSSSTLAEKKGDVKLEVFYTYDVLNKKDHLPKLVAENPQKKEEFLSDQDFSKIFGVDRSKFNSWPKWKRDSEKKKVGLF